MTKENALDLVSLVNQMHNNLLPKCPMGPPQTSHCQTQIRRGIKGPQPPSLILLSTDQVISPKLDLITLMNLRLGLLIRATEVADIISPIHCQYNHLTPVFSWQLKCSTVQPEGGRRWCLNVTYISSVVAGPV